MSDLVGNHIVGFPMRRLICCNVSQVPIITAEEHLLLDVVVQFKYFPFLSALCLSSNVMSRTIQITLLKFERHESHRTISSARER